MSTARHPQTDGQSEKQCLEMYLRCSVNATPTKWAIWLPLAEFWYNTSHHSSLSCSPFKALYGHEPHIGELPRPLTTDKVDVDQSIQERQRYSEHLKVQLHRAQAKMKSEADKHRSSREFQIEEEVFLKLQPYAQSLVVNRPFPKLAFKYFGPYKILEKIGPVEYKLALPEGSQVHPVFHVSQLKQHVPDHTPVFTTLPALLLMEVEDLQPALILDRRLVKKGNQALLNYQPQMLHGKITRQFDRRFQMHQLGNKLVLERRNL